MYILVILLLCCYLVMGDDFRVYLDPNTRNCRKHIASIERQVGQSAQNIKTCSFVMSLTEEQANKLLNDNDEIMYMSSI